MGDGGHRDGWRQHQPRGGGGGGQEAGGDGEGAVGRPLPRTWQPVARLEPTTVHCSCLLGTYLLPRTLHLYLSVAPLDCAVGGLVLMYNSLPPPRRGGEREARPCMIALAISTA